MTLIGACRDVLRVIRPERGVQPEELKPALDEVEILSRKLDEVWHDGWRGYAPPSTKTSKRLFTPKS